MLDFVCPQCGAAVDVAADSCPLCGASQRPDPPDPDETTAISGPPSAARRVGLDAVPVAPAPDDFRAASKPECAPPSVSQGSVGGGATLQVRHWHYALFVGLVGVAVLVAVALSGGFDRLRFEAPEEAGTSRVEAFGIGVLGPVEIAGIRPYYDGDYKARVRAFVANHSREETSVACLALLRVRDASNDAPPLATFEVVISNPLPPNQGMEVDVPLRAMGTLQSLPPWHEMRVDVEVLEVRTESP